jgi:hypothetical protein
VDLAPFLDLFGYDCVKPIADMKLRDNGPASEERGC